MFLTSAFQLCNWLDELSTGQLSINCMTQMQLIRSRKHRFGWISSKLIQSYLGYLDSQSVPCKKSGDHRGWALGKV